MDGTRADPSFCGDSPSAHRWFVRDNGKASYLEKFFYGTRHDKVRCQSSPWNGATLQRCCKTMGPDIKPLLAAARLHCLNTANGRDCSPFGGKDANLGTCLQATDTHKILFDLNTFFLQHKCHCYLDFRLLRFLDHSVLIQGWAFLHYHTNNRCDYNIRRNNQTVTHIINITIMT